MTTPTRFFRNLFNRKLFIVPLLITCSVWVAYYHLMTLTCSNSKSTKLIEDLCGLYRRGKVAGNMCQTLCSGDQLLFSHCGNNNVGKNVIMMQNRDSKQCRGASHLVLKTAFRIDQWMQDNDQLIKRRDTATGMIVRSKEAIRKMLESKFSVKFTNTTDVLSYIWGQNFSTFVQDGGGEASDKTSRSQAALFSILGLARQQEYSNLVILNKLANPFVSQLYGTCGPAYLVEYTPSLPYFGYVLYQGKLPEVLSLRPKFVSWPERVKVALQLLRTFEFLETLVPSVYMCDIRPHNFGIGDRNHLSILDVDSLQHNRIVPEDKVCKSDKDCSFITCEGRCNLTTNTCDRYPANSHLQAACRNIFLSDVKAFGLLRSPPSYIAEELDNLLNECILHGSSGQVPGQSDDILQQKLVSLLHRSLTTLEYMHLR